MTDSPLDGQSAEVVPAAPDASAPSQHAGASPAAKRVLIGSQRLGSEPVAPKPQLPVEVARPKPAPKQPATKTPVPSVRGKLSDELELEVAAALGDLSIEQALDTDQRLELASALEPESRHQGRIVSVHGDDVFVELPGRNQGLLSARQFPQAPEVGALIEIIVQNFNGEEGLYQLTLPGAAVDVGDWSSVAEGMIVEARVSGHNKGGLELELSNLRAFMPAGQIATYRVENLEQFVGEKFACLVTEVSAERRRLVLSRRALMEREQAEAKERLLGQLAEGQVREGTVRSIQDFGAFVDLGGVDGLLHVSQLSWQRVKHPSDVLSEGQRVKVLIRKIDAATGKISLAMRDLLENPWHSAAMKYTPNSIVSGRVTKLMPFGVFVELEPGVEGLVHISELAHHRVVRPGDVVQEGQEIEAKLLSVDQQQQRISLSIKAVQARPETQRAVAEEADDAPPPPLPKSNKPLKGGLGRAGSGSQFGLKW